MVFMTREGGFRFRCRAGSCARPSKVSYVSLFTLSICNTAGSVPKVYVQSKSTSDKHRVSIGNAAHCLGRFS